MDAAQKKMIDFIIEESRKEISYEEHLERQKALLLAQKEVECWKRLVYENGRFRDQYIREDRLDLKQVFKLRNMIYRVNEPRLKMVIDQDLERWMNEDDSARDNYQGETDTLRVRIDRMKRQIARYKDVYEKVQESNSYQMVQESSRKVREEQSKLEECQKMMDNLWKEGREKAKVEWNATKVLIVDLSKSCNESNVMDTEKETVLQNNEIKRVKIVQLHEDIARAKIEQEEEAKRREIELSERILIPIKITPMTLENTMFKNPNDFPALIDKIESTRKSYEQIFKRPEYMDLRKLKKKHRKDRSKSSSSVNFDLLFGLKRKSKTRKTQADTTAAAAAKQPTKPITGNEGVPDHQPTVVVEEVPSIPPAPKLDQSSTQVDRPTKRSSQSDKNLTKSQPVSVTNEQVPVQEPPKTPSKQSPVIRKRKASREATEDHPRPVCNVQGQRAKQRSTESISQPEPPAKSRNSAVSAEPPRKRPSLEKPISASAPAPIQEDIREFKKPQLIQTQSPERPSRKPKSKKVAFKSQPERFEPEKDNFSFSPEKPSPKTKSKDNFSFSPEKPSPKTKPKENFSFSPEKSGSKTKPKDNFSFSPEKPSPKARSKAKQQPVVQPQTSLPSPPSPPPAQQTTTQQPPTDESVESEDRMDFEPQDQTVHQTVAEEDTFSFGSASPPLDSRRQSKNGGSFFDTGSISSFDMEDRESDSDLGFDLSPGGPGRKNNQRRDGGEGEGSDGNTSDFDFLASPPNSGAPSGSQKGGGKKGQDSFLFTDDEDSGTGFDFF